MVDTVAYLRGWRVRTRTLKEKKSAKKGEDGEGGDDKK